MPPDTSKNKINCITQTRCISVIHCKYHLQNKQSGLWNGTTVTQTLETASYQDEDSLNINSTPNTQGSSTALQWEREDIRAWSNEISNESSC